MPIGYVTIGATVAYRSPIGHSDGRLKRQLDITEASLEQSGNPFTMTQGPLRRLAIALRAT